MEHSIDHTYLWIVTFLLLGIVSFGLNIALAIKLFILDSRKKKDPNIINGFKVIVFSGHDDYFAIIMRKGKIVQVCKPVGSRSLAYEFGLDTLRRMLNKEKLHVA